MNHTERLTNKDDRQEEEEEAVIRDDEKADAVVVHPPNQRDRELFVMKRVMAAVETVPTPPVPC